MCCWACLRAWWGGIIGFLFGIPQAPTTTTLGYRPSTNLEQVSDWLTKIIIGVSLVQANAIAARLAQTGVLVAGIEPRQGMVVPQIIIVGFAALGFFRGYIWTRLYYAGLQVRADSSIRSLLEARVAQVESTVKQEQQKAEVLDKNVRQIDKTTSLYLSGKLTTPSTTTALADNLTEERGAQEAARAAAPAADPVVADVRARVARFMAAPPSYDTDPAEEQFRDLSPPTAANGWRLNVELLATLEGGLSMEAVVYQTSALARGQEAILLLHPTFGRDKKLTLPVENGQAETNFFADEYFTVVAIIDEGRTVLAYDLRRLPGAPDWFTNPPRLRKRKGRHCCIEMSEQKMAGSRVTSPIM